jgi:hypothetical protein
MMLAFSLDVRTRAEHFGNRPSIEVMGDHALKVSGGTWPELPGRKQLSAKNALHRCQKWSSLEPEPAFYLSQKRLSLIQIALFHSAQCDVYRFR